jgi:hypothetical protein
MRFKKKKIQKKSIQCTSESPRVTVNTNGATGVGVPIQHSDKKYVLKNLIAQIYQACTRIQTSHDKYTKYMNVSYSLVQLSALHRTNSTTK